jgi:hypothetical protein
MVTVAPPPPASIAQPLEHGAGAVATAAVLEKATAR